MRHPYRLLVEEIHQATKAPLPDEPTTPRRSDLELLMDANAALRVLTDPGLLDGTHYRHRQTETKLARAEWEAASVRLDLRVIHERCAELMSQHEPLAGLGLDRELVRQVLHYVQTGRLK